MEAEFNSGLLFIGLKQTLLQIIVFVEYFHMLLKVVYLEQKHNRRIDTLIHHLLRVVKNVKFDWKREHVRIHRLCDINKSHKAAEKI